MKSKERSSYLRLILSMLIFGSIGIVRRYIPLTSGFISFTRGLTGSLFIALLTKIQRKKLFHHIGLKNYLIIASVGACLGFNWILLFEAYNNTTVAVATLCNYMSPTFVVFLSPICLHEKIPLKKQICALSAVVGMVLVSGIADGIENVMGDLKGILLGLGSAVFYAGIVILSKKVKNVDTNEKTVIQLFSASVALLPYLLLSKGFSGISVESKDIILLAVLGIVHTGITFALYFSSFANLSADTIAILSYLDPVSALILSAIILDEGMTLFGILGAVLIIGSAIISETDPEKYKKIRK